jgi:hypothetical protein
MEAITVVQAAFNNKRHNFKNVKISSRNHKQNFEKFGISLSSARFAALI